MKILFCITDNLWEPLLVSINSIIINNKDEDLEFYILHDQLYKDHADIIEKFVLSNGKKINILHVDKNRLFPKYEELGVRLPIEAYYRVFAIEVLKNVDKVLYLDADIVCNGSLNELWNMDFEGTCIIGVESKVDVTYEKNKAKIDSRFPFLNSGVMLMDLKEIRKIFKLFDVIEFLQSYSDYHYMYADQIFINSYFRGKIKVVEDRYNRKCGETFGCYEIFDRTEPAVLLHWAGSNVKPWSEYNDTVYLYDLDIYNNYCQLEVLGEKFVERIKYNLYHYENNIWIILENRYRHGRTGPTNQQVLLDYAWQKSQYGNVLENYLLINNYKKFAFYGMNVITQILLTELGSSSTEVLGIIDRKKISESYRGVKVMQPLEFRDNYMEKCDVIIVSIINEYRNIFEYLQKLKIDANIKPVSEMIFWFRD